MLWGLGGVAISALYAGSMLGSLMILSMLDRSKFEIGRPSYISLSMALSERLRKQSQRLNRFVSCEARI